MNHGRSDLHTALTHDREHCEATVLELLKLELGERDRVVGVRVPRLSEVAELSGCLERSKGMSVRQLWHRGQSWHRGFPTDL